MRTPKMSNDFSCEILIEAAIPELYRLNAFRVSGLNVNSSTRDIANQVKKNQMWEKYGGVNSDVSRPFPIEPVLDNEQVSKALCRLRDPETRLLDEFFWFWPNGNNSSNGDIPLLMLAQKEIDDVEKYWKNQEVTSAESDIAKHNLAVLFHLQALDFEQNGKEISDPIISLRDKYWASSFNRWNQLFEHDEFWSYLSSRVHQANDPRLTSSFVQSFRANLPRAILKINAHLALNAAESGDTGEAKRQLKLIETSGFSSECKLFAIKRVIEPLRNKIKITCKKVADAEHQTPAASLTASKELIKQTKPLLKVLDIMLPKGNAIREGAHDEVALETLSLLIDYNNNTGDIDLSVALGVYRHVEKIVMGESARARINQNHKIVKSNHEYKQLHNICFFCKKNRADDKSAIERYLHGDVKQTYLEVTWNYIAVKIPRCKHCAAIHNGKTKEHREYRKAKSKLPAILQLKQKYVSQRDTLLLLGIVSCIGLGIFTGSSAENYWNQICSEAEKYGNALISELTSFEIFLYGKHCRLWWTGVIVSLVSIILSRAAINYVFRPKILEQKQTIDKQNELIQTLKQKIPSTERYNHLEVFPQILELQSEGWKFGRKPKT